MKTVGVVGLGIIGEIWAGHYHAAGLLRGTWNRTPKPAVPLGLPSPEAVAKAADVIQIVVADPPAVRAVIDRMRPALAPGKLVIQSSTIDPGSSGVFCASVLKTGAAYVEAPFTGSKPAAENRETVFYLGGETDAVAAAEPVLASVSAVRFHIGTHAQAATLKLAMNLNLAAQMESLSEALTLVRKAGISDETFFSAMARNAGLSGLTRLKEPKLRKGDFSPQFSVKHMLKDMRLAEGIPDAAGMRALRAARECLEAAEKAGFGDDDFSSVIRLLK